MTRNVLLVEDEPDLLLVARLMLEDSGYAVIEASGGEAVELAEKAKVDAVFLLAARGATSYARRRAPLSAF
jgi:CheY-like chemotaxis protein